MNRIDHRFKELKKRGKKAFIAYITAGDPDLSSTAKLICGLERSGVDMIELGVPFSDPLADGPVIQAASQRSLHNGTTLKKIFSMVELVRTKTDIPLIFMTYYNPVLRFGPGRFIESCAKAGVDGVIIPDLPFDESKILIALGRKHGIATIFLAAPTSTAARLRCIAAISEGFIYYVSLTGVTGARKALPPETLEKVRFIKSLARTPVAVGFGISTAAQAREVAGVADGVIVGSALVKILAAGPKAIPAAERFAATIAKAVHS